MSIRWEYEKSMDQEGWQGQIQPDGSLDMGDTAHRTGNFHFLVSLTENKNLNKELSNYASDEFYKVQFDQLESKWGCYCRFPKKSYNLEPQHYYNEGPYLGVMSRDQTQSLIIAAGIKNDYKRILRMMVTHALRLFLFTQKSKRFLSEKENDNVWRKPDFTGFEFFALYLRAIPVFGYILYPLVLLGDIETLIGSIGRRTWAKDDDDVANHVSICIFGMQRVWSPIMWLANKINSYEDMKQKQYSYWAGWRNQEFYVTLFDAPMKKYFGK